MLTRILTALIGVVVFFAALAAPSGFFPLIIFAVTAIMLGEMYSVLKCGKGVNILGYLTAVLAFEAIGYAGGVLGGGRDALSIFLTATVFFYLIAVVLMHGKKSSKEILAHGFVTLYISVCMSYIARIDWEFSSLATLWVFVIAWLCDSGAYFAGVFLGKHKLCPHISPKKTVEGAIGGILASTIACGVYYFILIKTGVLGDSFKLVTLAGFMAMGLFGSALSQVGDFVASAIKRDYDVKDYGKVLPGHGGLMDRFDSVVFIAPFVYYSLYLLNWTMVI